LDFLLVVFFFAFFFAFFFVGFFGFELLVVRKQEIEHQLFQRDYATYRRQPGKRAQIAFRGDPFHDNTVVSGLVVLVDNQYSVTLHSISPGVYLELAAPARTPHDAFLHISS
jgi:hypothetical protein